MGEFKSMEVSQPHPRPTHSEWGESNFTSQIVEHVAPTTENACRSLPTSSAGL